jgi:hypothetical protein
MAWTLLSCWINEFRRHKYVKYAVIAGSVGWLALVAGALQLLNEKDILLQLPYHVWNSNQGDPTRVANGGTESDAEFACRTALEQITNTKAAYDATPNASNLAAWQDAQGGEVLPCTGASQQTWKVKVYNGVRGKHTKTTLTFPSSYAGTIEATDEWNTEPQLVTMNEGGDWVTLVDDWEDSCHDMTLSNVIPILQGVGVLLALFAVYFTAKRREALSDHAKNKTMLVNFLSLACMCGAVYHYYDRCGSLARVTVMREHSVSYESSNGIGLYCTCAGIVLHFFTFLVNFWLPTGTVEDDISVFGG